VDSHAATPAERDADTVAIELETRERVVRTGVIGLPLAGLAVAAWFAWGGSNTGGYAVVADWLSHVVTVALGSVRSTSSCSLATRAACVSA